MTTDTEHTYGQSRPLEPSILASLSNSPKESYEHALDLKFADADRLAALSSEQRQLYRRLSRLRLRLAREAQIPAYQVLGNQGLLNLCEQQPRTLEALAAIKTFGQMRQRAYGAEFLLVLSQSP